MNYQIEIKQIVDFPRVRIYRDFIRTLITEKGIRTSGSSFLFYYIVLCSYANYRISYRRLESITYTVGPGEWICTVSDLQEWFRCRFQHQAISILNQLEQQNYISYTMLGNRKLIKFKITGWKKDNTALDYSCPCKKNDGFFFFPIAKVHELIGMGKCSEMDILLDLWIHAIYNDPQGYSTAQQFSISRHHFDRNGQPMKSPWRLQIVNGKGIKVTNQNGGAYMQSGSFSAQKNAFIQLSDIDLYTLLKRADSYITQWENCISASLISNGKQMLSYQQAQRQNQSTNTSQQPHYPQQGIPGAA